MNTHTLSRQPPQLRFAFGANWRRFLDVVDAERIDAAVRSLQETLDVATLQGRSFLDIGCGSGLFSLAARRLGAHVHSFDYDADSVACTLSLREQHGEDDADWAIEQGSVLDARYMRSLGQYDFVYSWGVLHHTGAMYEAFANIVPAVAPRGKLLVAIYNDQGLWSRYWTQVKRVYNRNRAGAACMAIVHAPYLLGARFAVRALQGRLSLERGMSMYYDMLDWLGGYPFEVARPEEVFRHFRALGFTLDYLRTCGGRMGCNELVFRRGPYATTPAALGR